jgi:proliferating cell nuclear antigen
MFEAKFSSATFLKRILNAVKDLVTDANLLCTEDGMELQAMDSAHVSLVNLTVLPEACSHYSCSKSLTLGVNLVSFAKILGCPDGEDSVTLKLDDTDTSILVIETESPTGTRSARYALNLLDIESDHLVIPDTEYSCSVKLPSADLTRMVKDLQVFGETCDLLVETDRMTMEVKGDLGTSSMTVRDDRTAKITTEITCPTSIRMLIALKYIAAFTKAQSLSDHVVLFLSEGIPIHVVYDMGDRGSIGYHLAPKTTED